MDQQETKSKILSILNSYFPLPVNEIILYFGGLWSVPHGSYVLDKLIQLHPLFTTAQISMLFISADFDETRFCSHIMNMPWGKVRFNDKDNTNALMRYYNVGSAPRIVVLDKTREKIDDVLEYFSSQDLDKDVMSACSTLHCLTKKEYDLSELSSPCESLPDKEIRKQATTLFDEGDYHGAAELFSSILSRTPDCTISNFNMGVILHTMGLPLLSIEYLIKVVDENPQDATAHYVLKSVLYPLEPEAVISNFKKLVQKNPNNVRAAHSIASLTGDATNASPGYVKEVFDELADSFEQKLVVHLEYKVPWLLLDAVKEISLCSESSKWTVLDLGCGTGLCGRLFKPFSARLIGVDLSPAMIEKSRGYNVYDELHTTDILNSLKNFRENSIDLIISADVWIYVGDLNSSFSLCRQRLKVDKGYICFSIELLDESVVNPTGSADICSSKGYLLAPSGRFQHSLSYINELCTIFEFKILFQEKIIVRKESNDPIYGYVYVLQRTGE